MIAAPRPHDIDTFHLFQILWNHPTLIFPVCEGYGQTSEIGVRGLAGTPHSGVPQAREPWK